ncbi:hypothetical protein [Hymenobacter metallicola]|uniref:Outer membrane protein beta-barrel domain-containing protein n=1 Tax=Hymenobacter metallicola TaxID=2563114 RepID=A0A4Z0QKW7_9BACT|nr:hypothetical protein [Hymenobacter metallicola]TGE29883.1 hypothetical protein E5K02_10615 [Hymenobacter metallicola]
MKTYLLPVGLLISGAAQAQTLPAVEPPAHYRWFAGVATGLQLYETISRPGPIRYLGKVGLTPFFVSGGYQLTPRLAVQAEFSQRDPADRNVSSSGYSPDGQLLESTDRRREYDAAVPLLARYRLTRPQQAFHIDGLLGISILYHVYRQEIILSADGVPYSHYLIDETAWNKYLTGGLGAGLTVRQRVDVGLNLVINQNLETVRRTIEHFAYYSIKPSLTLSARYFFIRRPVQRGAF